MKQTMKAIQSEVSEHRVYETVKEISSFHRIQASTGFRKAAHFICEKLQKQGLDAKVLSYAADENHWYLEQKLFREWDCRKGWMEIEGLGRVSDYEEVPCSIMQKSYPCRHTEEALEIVEVKNTDPAYLDTLDLAGKIAFIHEKPNAYLYPVIKERGALGFVTDTMQEIDPVRARHDALDTYSYTSFWWDHNDEEPETWGYVITPRIGDKLKKMLDEGKTVTAKCLMDTSVYPGEMEVVEVTLPGESDDIIMAIAHLCHPRPSANDNASGAAGSTEAVRVLHDLIEAGKIAPLKKTIKLTLVPEMTGSYCYLSGYDNYDKMQGAINMDMIGGRQNGTYGPITITGVHHGSHSPLTSIASMVLKYAQRQASAVFGGDPVPMVNASIEDFTGGSDHIIYSDPSLDIPCIMLGQWPDKYYHTSSDTLEVVDPKVLAFSTTFAAGFLYALSNFDAGMHKETLMHHARRMVLDMEKYAEKTDPEKLANRIDHLERFYTEAVNDFTRYGDVNTEGDAEYIRTVAEATKKMLGITEAVKPVQNPAYDWVPVRTFTGPIDKISAYACLSEENKQIVAEYNKEAEPYGFAGMMMTMSVLNYVDGKRTVNEIAYEIEQEDGTCNVEFLNVFLNTLVKLGKITKN